jgi:AcrR family transcriptional regulator
MTIPNEHLLTRSETKDKSGIRDKSATKEAFLKSGARLLQQQPPAVDIAQMIRTHDVIEGAGKSEGSFYKHFGTVHRFAQELIGYILSPERFRALQNETIEFVRQMANVGLRLEDVVRGGAKKNFDDIASDPYFILQLEMLLRGSNDEVVHALLRDLYRGLNDRYVELYEEMLSRFGRRMKRDYTSRQLAVVLNASVEGLVIRRIFDPDAVRPTEDGKDLFGEVAWCIVMGMTEPVESEEDEVGS